MRCRTALFAAAAALPLAVGAHAQTAAPATAQVAPIAYTTRTLANGLRVYAIRDTATANVSVQVWYDVGSKDDPRDRSGFAHLFEHLMFKSTRNLVSEQFDRLTEDVGGNNNASTADDYTEYHEVVPANHLQRLLFAEGDRMASLVIDPATFASERDVVKEELRQSVLSRPYGKLYSLYYPWASYTTHPYARPGIGSIENLDAASIDDVRAFHATYYRPDNAVLVVAGNFDAAQLDRWIDQYFAGIARPARPIPRVAVTEPPRTRAVSYDIYETNTPLPAALISWQLPPERSPDLPALEVLDAILATGENSRLYRALVYRDGLAQSASTFLDTKQATGNLVAVAVMASGKDVRAGEAALRREVARMRDETVTAAELAEAKNELLTQDLRQRETAEGQAAIIANAVIVDGDPAAADRESAAVARVTAADVQRVARQYLSDAQSAAIRYRPAAAGATSDRLALATTVVTAPLVAPPGISVVVPATAAERVQPPAPGPLVVAALPNPVESRLANGLRVVSVAKPGQPIVTALLVADGGGSLDRADMAGAASLTAELMTKGTQRYTAGELAAATEALGTQLSSSATRDGASLGLTVKADAIVPALGILAEVALRPRFAPDELARARTQAIDTAALSLADPAELAGLAASRAAFGDGAYGAPLDGTPTSLRAIDAATPAAIWRATWRPERTTLILVGDVTAAQARSLAQQAFGGWATTGAARPGSRLTPRAGLPTAPTSPRVIVIDQPDAGQASIVVARPALARSTPDYYPALVANAVLGTGFSSRLNQEIRIKRGLAYGARSSLAARRDGGLVSASTQTKNVSAAEVVTLIATEMTRLGRTPTAPAELDTRKAVLTGGFGRAIETTAGIAGTLAEYVTQRVPLTTLSTYASAVNAIAPASVQAAAAHYLDPTTASIVVVGDAKAFVPALRKSYPQLEVIAAKDVALDRPALR